MFHFEDFSIFTLFIYTEWNCDSLSILRYLLQEGAVAVNVHDD